jgi:arsenate reductase
MKRDDFDPDDEPREYSSPACLLHEFPEWHAEPVTLYHNPACSKSREALALLQQSGIQPRVVEYLRTPPGAAELTAIIAKLGIAPLDLIRKGEAVFQEKYRDQTLSDAEWIAAMVADPILIERPIAVRGSRAELGRPPANIKRLLP